MWMVVSERAWLVEKQSQQGRNCMKMCVKMTLFMTVDGGEAYNSLFSTTIRAIFDL